MSVYRDLLWAWLFEVLSGNSHCPLIDVITINIKREWVCLCVCGGCVSLSRPAFTHDWEHIEKVSAWQSDNFVGISLIGGQFEAINIARFFMLPRTVFVPRMRAWYILFMPQKNENRRQIKKNRTARWKVAVKTVNRKSINKAFVAFLCGLKIFLFPRHKWKIFFFDSTKSITGISGFFYCLCIDYSSAFKIRLFVDILEAA